MTTYAFDNAWRQARERLALLETCLDPATTRRMTALGVGAGWRCLDVRAGGGAVAQWLCTRVGAGGQSWPRTSIPGSWTRSRNRTSKFADTTSSRTRGRRRPSTWCIPGWCSCTCPTARSLLGRLVAALKPGGWLLLEEQDLFPITAVASGIYADLWAAFHRAAQTFGSRGDWARGLPALLAAQGLAEVGAEGDVPFFAGAAPMDEFWRLTWEQLRAGIVQAGAGQHDVDQALRLLADPEQRFIGPAIVAAWGRRAGA